MYIIKNAWKNLGRNKGRNWLLCGIIFVLMMATTIALLIHTTANTIITNYKTQFGSKVALRVDLDKLMTETTPNADGSMSFPTAPSISSEQYVAFSKSKHLKSYRMNMTYGVTFEDMKAIDEEQQDHNSMVASIGDGQETFVAPKAKLLGYSNIKDMKDFSEGLRKIVKGKLYSAKNECLISTAFADLNALKVGDTFRVNDTMSDTAITLLVSGIYADATKENGNLPEGAMSLGGSYSNRRNEIFVNLATISSAFETSNIAVEAEYELKSPAVLKKFEKEVREKGIPSVYNVETDEAGYYRIVGPVIGLSTISMTLMWVILAVGCAILIFITSMAIRERKYEIGVLRAMGMKKRRVTLMLVTEMFMMTTICLITGLCAGSALSQGVADSLIADQNNTNKNPQEQHMGGNIASISSIGEQDEKPIANIQVALTAEAVMQIMMIALGIALVSSISGVISITKYEPMRILSERD